MKRILVFLIASGTLMAQSPSARSPAVPEADGYIEIPNAALPPARTNTYRAVFDATRGADEPSQLLPALNMAGSELNALAVAKVPLTNANFAIVFHGRAVDGILDETHYRAKFGMSNPNLKAIAQMKKQGVEFFVCGQYLAAEKIEPKSLTPEVKLAADALLVLMYYQNKGYALMSF